MATKPLPQGPIVNCKRKHKYVFEYQPASGKIEMTLNITFPHQRHPFIGRIPLSNTVIVILQRHEVGIVIKVNCFPVLYQYISVLNRPTIFKMATRIPINK